jgi:hypothetical protein
MAEYIFLMHDDSAPYDESAWAPYLRRLEENGSFEGGGAIGDGICARKRGTASSITAHLRGCIRVTAGALTMRNHSWSETFISRRVVRVEIRELPRTS